MKTLFTTAAALVLTAGIAAAETASTRYHSEIGDLSLFGLVEAGNPRAVVDVGTAAGFTGRAANPGQRPRYHSEIGDLSLFGQVTAGNGRFAIDVGRAAGFTRGPLSGSMSGHRDPASGTGRIFHGR